MDSINELREWVKTLEEEVKDLKRQNEEIREVIWMIAREMGDMAVKTEKPSSWSEKDEIRHYYIVELRRIWNIKDDEV